MKKDFSYCCCGRFPTFAVFLLVIGVFWLLSDLKIINVNIPWWPLLLIVVALGWIVNAYNKK